MKKIIYLLVLIVGFTQTSCTPDEVTIYPLENSGEGDFVSAELIPFDVTSFEIIETTNTQDGNETDTFTVNWSSAEAVGDVTYNIQMDIAGNNFAMPVNVALGQSPSVELSKIITYGELNEILNKIDENLLSVASALSVNFVEANEIEVRIESILNVTESKIYSQPLTINVLPFPNLPPIPEALFLVGSINAWNAVDAFPFNNPLENVFTLVVDLPANAEFKFIPTNVDFSDDWGADPSNAGEIVIDGEDNVSGYPAGKYLVKVDFNTFTYSLSVVDSLYLVGSLTGWDPSTSLPMAEASLGVFSIIIDLPAGAEFKFLPSNTGWDGDWGADSGNSGFIIQDGEANLSGYDAGKYVVAINFNTLSYSVSSITSIPATLYLVGSFNGWNNDASSPQFTEVSSGIFQIVQTLSDTDEFKFVPVAGSWDNDWGQNSDYLGVLEQNAEGNILSAGSSVYLITVDFNQGTIAVQ